MKYLIMFLAMIALGCDTPHSPSNASQNTQSEEKAGALGQQGRSHLDEHNESETANEHPEQGSSIGDTQHPPSASHFDHSPTLSPRQILARASIDLRGQRPTREELAAIDARPESLHAMIDDFIAGPKLGNLLMDLAARWLRSRIEFYPIPNANEESDPNLSYSVAEEPLRLFKYIVDNDRSYELSWQITHWSTNAWRLSGPSKATTQLRAVGKKYSIQMADLLGAIYQRMPST